MLSRYLSDCQCASSRANFRRQERGHLLFDQLMLLHRGGENDLGGVVSPRLPVRRCVSVIAVLVLRRIGQPIHHVVNVGHVVQ
jgi:hypothetical protein